MRHERGNSVRQITTVRTTREAEAKSEKREKGYRQSRRVFILEHGKGSQSYEI